MTSETEPRSQIVILCADLMFQSQITGAARLNGFSFTCVLSLAQALGELTDELPQLLIIDLNQPEIDWELLTRTMQQFPQLTSIAYGPPHLHNRIAHGIPESCAEAGGSGWQYPGHSARTCDLSQRDERRSRRLVAGRELRRFPSR
ncbi:MAG: hypothetical protein ACF8CY_01735, partial [Gimesia chilikensis]